MGAQHTDLPHKAGVQYMTDHIFRRAPQCMACDTRPRAPLRIRGALRSDQIVFYRALCMLYCLHVFHESRCLTQSNRLLNCVTHVPTKHIYCRLQRSQLGRAAPERPRSLHGQIDQQRLAHDAAPEEEGAEKHWGAVGARTCSAACGTLRAARGSHYRCLLP